VDGYHIFGQLNYPLYAREWPTVYRGIRDRGIRSADEP